MVIGPIISVATRLLGTAKNYVISKEAEKSKLLDQLYDEKEKNLNLQDQLIKEKNERIKDYSEELDI